MIVRITTPPGHGPRLYVGGLRIHHGMVGAALAVVGGLLAAHDFHDYPWSFRDTTPQAATAAEEALNGRR